MQKVKLNIVPKGVKRATYLSQNDNGRVVRYELFNELVPYTLDGSETITVKVVRPDGVEIVSSVPNTEAAYIDVTFNDDMSAIAGVGAGEIKITDGETVLGSHNFDINVETDAYNGRDVVIETATGTLAEFDTEVEDNALEYESEIPYNAEGYTGLRVINSRTAPVFNKTPYLFRKTPSGNSCIEELNGLSVAFNQLANINTGVSEGATITVDVNGVVEFSGVTTGNPMISHITHISGHKYLCLQKTIANPNNIDFTLGMDSGSPWITNGDIVGEHNSIYTSVYDTYFKLFYANGQDLTGIKLSIQIIDLTQMFGSTIADYIYSLETAQAGAGVAYFKNLFGEDYYPFNAGELMSVKTSGRKTIGFNQWDEVWEVGTINDSGANATDNAKIRSKNYITLIPNAIYFIACPSTSKNGKAFFYDSNKTFISSVWFYGNTPTTPPSNARYMRFRMVDAYGTTYNHDICINFSDPDLNGQYKPYESANYDFTGSRKVWRRYGIVDLGSLTWGYNSTNAFFYASVSGIKYKTSVLLAVGYITISSKLPAEMASAENMTICTRNYDGEQIQIKNVDYTDAASFKSAMDGVYLIYELAEPYEETVNNPELRGLFKLDSNNNIYADGDIFTDFDNPQEVKVTEEFIDERATPIPVGHDTLYGTDLELTDIDFNETIYGGDIDAVNGVLTSRYNSDGSVKTTPDIIDITPTLIPVRAGDNNIVNSANGNQTIRYYNQVEE